MTQSLAKHGASYQEVTVEDMTFSDENADIQVKLIFTSMFGGKDNSGKLKIDGMEFYLLLRDKD